MYKPNTLTSIPEMDIEEEMGRKWVPKKKHEVLKAKYKCLKKLFQIYDASVVGILPENNTEIVEETKTNRRRKRSHRTKSDACAGTTEPTNGDNISDCDYTSVGTTATRDLQIDHSCISTQIDSKIDTYAETIPKTDIPNSSHTESCNHESNDFIPCQLNHYNRQPTQYLVFNEKQKLTRFQCFVQRLFGIRKESYMSPKDHIYAASDNLVRDRRRRRGLRFRRLRRPKKIKSEGAIRDMRSPTILSYVQSVQRNCLMDTTPRLCPIVGCKMISYGIINYNDHLNLCHFKDRKYICNYCHEGFDKECDKVMHENEHIGISKISTNISNINTSRDTSMIACNTQTDPETKIPEEKLKKIVSFFDKIADPDQILTEIKKNRASECNLRSESSSEDSDKSRPASSCNIRRKGDNKLPSSSVSEASHKSYTPLTCHYCGENFRFRRQLSLHEDLEHRVYDKFSKFHSCAGIINRSPRVDMISEDGRINVQSVKRSDTSSSIRGLNSPSTIIDDTVSRRKSAESVSCDPSTNIVYYTSSESVTDSLSPARAYRWEPGARAVRL